MREVLSMTGGASRKHRLAGGAGRAIMFGFFLAGKPRPVGGKLHKWTFSKNPRIDAMKIRYKIWLEKDGKVIFGKGRDEMFRAILECKSLQAAAKELKMSYRAAWGRLKASEERLGIKLVESDGAKKSLRLTAEARELLEQYEQFEKELNDFLQKKSKALGWDKN
jgi:molybdate transport system regulatory protein